MYSVSGILGQTKHMCVLKGSTVDLPCSGTHHTLITNRYTGLFKDLFNFKQLSDVTGHVEKTPDSQSTRRIDEVQQSHANTYQCTDSADISHFSLHVTGTVVVTQIN